MADGNRQLTPPPKSPGNADGRPPVPRASPFASARTGGPAPPGPGWRAAPARRDQGGGTPERPRSGLQERRLVIPEDTITPHVQAEIPGGGNGGGGAAMSGHGHGGGDGAGRAGPPTSPPHPALRGAASALFSVANPHLPPLPGPSPPPPPPPPPSGLTESQRPAGSRRAAARLPHWSRRPPGRPPSAPLPSAGRRRGRRVTAARPRLTGRAAVCEADTLLRGRSSAGSRTPPTLPPLHPCPEQRSRRRRYEAVRRGGGGRGGGGGGRRRRWRGPLEGVRRGGGAAGAPRRAGESRAARPARLRWGRLPGGGTGPPRGPRGRVRAAPRLEHPSPGPVVPGCAPKITKKKKRAERFEERPCGRAGEEEEGGRARHPLSRAPAGALGRFPQPRKDPHPSGVPIPRGSFPRGLHPSGDVSSVRARRRLRWKQIYFVTGSIFI